MRSGISWIGRWLIAAPMTVWSCPPAGALLVAPPATNDNTSAPMDDPGWANVGDRGVYLGNRWVITAGHVGAGPTIFNGGGPFMNEPGSEMTLVTPAGLGMSTTADVMLFRLTADPGLPALPLSLATPPVDDTVVLIGDGRGVESDAMETHWDASWMEVPESSGVHHGYKSTTSRMLWGTNRVENDGHIDPGHTVVIDLIGRSTVSFFTQFDKTGVTTGVPTASEAQGLGGDSGSAMFHKEGGVWKLAGLTFAIGTEPGQPDITSTAVYGNVTFAADLSFYASQIYAITAIPEVGSVWLLGSVAVLVGVGRVLKCARGKPRL
jgi:hypothetical protein